MVALNAWLVGRVPPGRDLWVGGGRCSAKPVHDGRKPSRFHPYLSGRDNQRCQYFTRPLPFDPLTTTTIPPSTIATDFQQLPTLHLSSKLIRLICLFVCLMHLAILISPHLHHPSFLLACPHTRLSLIVSSRLPTHLIAALGLSILTSPYASLAAYLSKILDCGAVNRPPTFIFIVHVMSSFQSSSLVHPLPPLSVAQFLSSVLWDACDHPCELLYFALHHLVAFFLSNVSSLKCILFAANSVRL